MKKAIFLAAIVLANAINSLAVETELLSVKTIQTIWGPKQSGKQPIEEPSGRHSVTVILPEVFATTD